MCCTERLNTHRSVVDCVMRWRSDVASTNSRHPLHHQQIDGELATSAVIRPTTDCSRLINRSSLGCKKKRGFNNISIISSFFRRRSLHSFLSPSLFPTRSPFPSHFVIFFNLFLDLFRSFMTRISANFFRRIRICCRSVGVIPANFD